MPWKGAGHPFVDMTAETQSAHTVSAAATFCQVRADGSGAAAREERQFRPLPHFGGKDRHQQSLLHGYKDNQR